VQDLHAGRRYGGDDLAEGPLPFNRPAGRERVVDVAAGEVTAILPDPRLVLIPRPQGHRRVRFADEQVAGGPEQARNVASPPGQVRHPDQGAFPGVDQVGARVGQRCSGNYGDDVAAGSAELIRAALRCADGDLAVVDSDHGPRSRPHEGDIIQAVAALQVNDLGRAAQYLPQQVTLRAGEGGAGGRLRQEIAVLANVLLGRCLPGCPVRLRRGVHNAMLMPGPSARQAIKASTPLP
jgi:hypothetical protein